VIWPGLAPTTPGILMLSLTRRTIRYKMPERLVPSASSTRSGSVTSPVPDLVATRPTRSIPRRHVYTSRCSEQNPWRLANSSVSRLPHRFRRRHPSRGADRPLQHPIHAAPRHPEALGDIRRLLTGCAHRL